MFATLCAALTSSSVVPPEWLNQIPYATPFMVVSADTIDQVPKEPTAVVFNTPVSVLPVPWIPKKFLVVAEVQAEILPWVSISNYVSKGN